MRALAIGITQHCLCSIGFRVKALHELQYSRGEMEEALSVCTSWAAASP